MTEQEIMQSLGTSEYQLVTAYKDLVTAARSVGTEVYRATQSSRARAVANASSGKTAKTLLPLLISLLGILIFSVAWFLGIDLIAGGIIFSYFMNKKANEELSGIKRLYDTMIETARNQQDSLNSMLDINRSI